VEVILNRRLYLLGLVGVILIAFTFSSCTKKIQNGISAPLTPAEIPTPSENKASITGRVIDEITGQALPNTAVLLAKVHYQDGQGIFVLEDAHAPGDLTDENGYFIIQDIDPLEYVIVVGDTMTFDGYTIIQNADGKARVYSAEANNILDVSDLRVTLSQ
jgi:hypothetical protein